MLQIDRTETTTLGEYSPSKLARIACAECGSQLTIWHRHDEAHPGGLLFYIVCIADKTHEGIKQRRTMRQAWREGEVVYPAAQAKYEREAEQEVITGADMGLQETEAGEGQVVDSDTGEILQKPFNPVPMAERAAKTEVKHGDGGTSISEPPSQPKPIPCLSSKAKR